MKNHIFTTVRLVRETAGRMFTTLQGIIRRLAMGALLAATIGLVQTRGDMLVTHWSPGRVLRYDEQTGAYLGTLVPEHSGGLEYAVGLGFGRDGNLYVTDSMSNRILRYDGTTGAFLSVFATNGLNSPYGMVVGSNGNLFVCNTVLGNIAEFDGLTGALVKHFGDGNLANPYGMTFGPDGLLYVADRKEGVVRFDAASGELINVFCAPENFSTGWANGVTFGPDGNLYVTDGGNHAGGVFRFNGSTGMAMGVFAAGGGLWNPAGLVFGPDGNLYVVSNNYGGGGNRGTQGVIRYDGTTGDFIDQFATGGVSGVWGLQFAIFTPPLRANIRASEVQIGWNSISNHTYRVEYRSSLTGNIWAPLVDCVRAVGATASVFDKIMAGTPQKFYRVVETNCVPLP